MFIAYPDEIRTLLRTFNSAEFLSWGNTPTTYEQVEDAIFYGERQYCEDAIENLMEAKPYGYKMSIRILEDIIYRS